PPMTRKSGLRALVLSFAVLAAVAISLGGMLFVHGSPTAHADATAWEGYLDCDPGQVGIQSSCIFPSGTTSLNIDVLLKNNSGTATQLGAFNFDVITNQQAIFNPTTVADTNLDGNPDFDQAAVTGIWSCSPPGPKRDTNSDPNI